MVDKDLQSNTVCTSSPLKKREMYYPDVPYNNVGRDNEVNVHKIKTTKNLTEILVPHVILKSAFKGEIIHYLGISNCNTNVYQTSTGNVAEDTGVKIMR